MFLATTPIQGPRDPKERVLLLGPWCLDNEKSRESLKGKDFIMAPSPWRPAVKIKEAADYSYDIYERLLSQLARSLNSIHQVSYPVNYWQVLLGHWLLSFIGIFYDRYKRIENVMEFFPDFYTSALSKDRCKPYSYDTYDFYSKTEEDYYNLKLFSIILYDLCPDNIKGIVASDYGPEYSVHPGPRYSWKRKIFNRLIGLLDPFLKSPILLSDMYHLTPRDMALLKLKNGFKTFRFAHFESMKKGPLRNNYSSEIRDTVELEGAMDRFQSLLYRIIPEAIPIYCLEDYKSCKTSIRNINNIDSVRIVGSAVGWFTNEMFKFFAAEAVSRGAMLIDFQHGGGYGLSLTALQEKISLQKDIFYTWGWDLERANGIKLLPSPHLSRLKDTYSLKLDNILFVGAAMSRYHRRFHAELLPDDMPKYFEDKKIFFQSLRDMTKNKILYRPQVTLEWREMDAIKKACPDIRFILKGRLVDWMKRVKLVVIDHPHTSFIEALTIGCPCVFYWDHEVYLMRTEAEGYFDLLRDVGILFKDPSSAAKKVEEISRDPMSWWLQDNVQDARMKFCKRYAYARKDWANIWTKELKQLLIECENIC